MPFVAITYTTTWHKINFPFSPYCPPLLPPHDNVDFAPAMRHDILGLALRIGCNIAEIGGEGEQQKREVIFVELGKRKHSQGPLAHFSICVGALHRRELRVISKRR